MPPRRISHGAPLLNTSTEQKALLHAIETRPDLQDAIGILLDKPLAETTKQERLAALRAYQQLGMALAPVRMTARIMREVISEAGLANTAALQAENDELTAQVEKLKRKKRKLKRALRQLEGDDQS